MPATPPPADNYYAELANYTLRATLAALPDNTKLPITMILRPQGSREPRVTAFPHYESEGKDDVLAMIRALVEKTRTQFVIVMFTGWASGQLEHRPSLAPDRRLMVCATLWVRGGPARASILVLPDGQTVPDPSQRIDFAHAAIPEALAGTIGQVFEPLDTPLPPKMQAQVEEMVARWRKEELRRRH